MYGMHGRNEEKDEREGERERLCAMLRAYPFVLDDESTRTKIRKKNTQVDISLAVN